MTQKIPPLNWQTPIVTVDRRPTPEFMRYFQQLGGNDALLEQTKQDADDDLDALAALDATGIVVRTADAAYSLRSIAVESGELTVTDGDGVAGDPTLGLADSGVTPGSYTNADITVDEFGRVTVAANGSAGSSYTDEEAQDAVGGILTDSSTIEFTYDDVTPSISASVKADSIGSTELDETGVTPGTYGDGTHSARIQVDANGRVVTATSVAISAGGGSGTAYVPMTDGAEPPSLLTDGAGQLLLTPWSP